MHIEKRLLDKPVPESEAVLLDPDWIPDVPFNDPPVSAAVLIALVEREHGLCVVYTLRSSGLRSHSGQIAFPGGKIDPQDAGASAAALREAREEIGLDPAAARVLGYMPAYMTGTNYLITPVVASVTGNPHFRPNPVEVDEVFEVPLATIMKEESFSRFAINRNGRVHRTWQLEHEVHVIWGITANLTRGFRDLALVGLDR